MIQTKQGEQVAVPFKCGACGGEGGSEVATCSVCDAPESRGGGCAHARWRWEECPDCLGTGLEQCGVCGDDSATELMEDGTKACRFCFEGGCEPNDDTEPSDSWDSESNRMMADFYARRDRERAS